MRDSVHVDFIGVMFIVVARDVDCKRVFASSCSMNEGLTNSQWNHKPTSLEISKNSNFLN